MPIAPDLKGNEHIALGTPMSGFRGMKPSFVQVRMTPSMKGRRERSIVQVVPWSIAGSRLEGWRRPVRSWVMCLLRLSGHWIGVDPPSGASLPVDRGKPAFVQGLVCSHSEAERQELGPTGCVAIHKCAETDLMGNAGPCKTLGDDAEWSEEQ